MEPINIWPLESVIKISPQTSNTMNKVIKTSISIFFLLAFSLILAQAAWNEPSSPSVNIPAPISATADGQIKTGNLIVPFLSIVGDTLTGFVGIGGDANNSNSIPKEKLDLQGNMAISGQILSDNNSGTPGQVLHFKYSTSTGNPYLDWDNNYIWLTLTSDVKNNNCNGNGICNAGETCGNCPGDCVPPVGKACEVSTGATMAPVCDLDKKCEASIGENSDNCRDCRGCENEGLGCNNNGTCEDEQSSSSNEGWQSCPNDCVCSSRKYKPQQVVNGFCGDGIVQAPEECDPPGKRIPPFGAKALCDPWPVCGPDCKWEPVMIWGGKNLLCSVFCEERTLETVSLSLGEPVNGGGGGGCQNNAPTGAPQCGGSCPQGNSCQDNNGANAGGTCQCLPDPAPCGNTYPQCGGSCPQPTDVCVKGTSGTYANTCYCSPTTPDTTPPSLSFISLTNVGSTVKIDWNSAGDDGNVGTPTSYDIRYSTTQITNGNFSNKPQVTNPPAPQVAGTPMSATVSGLLVNTKYYFALKTLDEVPNTSVISNLPNITTSSGGSSPSLNDSGKSNLSLFEEFINKFTNKAEATTNCNDIWLPLSCFGSWNEESLKCVNNGSKPYWTRTCFKIKEF